MKIRPLEDRVVIEQLEAEEKTAGGICCPTPPRRSRSAAACSPSAPASCSTTASAPRSASSKGDEVLYGKYSGTEIKVDGKEIKILRESDILAKIVK